MTNKFMLYLFLVLAALGLTCPFYGQTPVFQPVFSYWTFGGVNSGGAISLVQNKELYSAYDITTPVVANSVCVRPTTADNTATNNYSFALYNSSGALILSTGVITGAVFAPSTAALCMALSTVATVPAGRYYASFTTNCSTACAVLAGTTQTFFIPLAAHQGVATTGGAPNSTIVVPADSYGNPANTPWFEIHK